MVDLRQLLLHTVISVERQKYLKMFIVIIAARGTPDVAIGGIFDTRDAAEAQYDNLALTDVDPDDISIREVAVNTPIMEWL